MKHGKKYTDSRKLVDSTKLYEPAEALEPSNEEKLLAEIRDLLKNR